jgi:uncharacterized repeat protein (TIGR03803 family)
VFEIKADGTEKVLHAFAGGSDGAGPNAGLILDDRGNRYGTTSAGGGTGGFCGETGCGTVFKLAPNGNEVVLYAFTGGSDGYAPFGGLIADAKGNLYGTVCCGGDGVVFELSRNGILTVLYSFAGGDDGAGPIGSLIMDKKGNIYGTTNSGGTGCNAIGGCGTVFKLTPTGTETVLHTFTDGRDGGYPAAGLIADSDGNLYGTTSTGGAGGNETVFKVKE